MNSYLGIEIGGTKLQLVKGDETGRIMDRCRFVIEPTLGAQRILKQIEACLDPVEGKSGLGTVDWKGVGVAYGGPVDLETGRIVKSHHVPGWDGFPLRDWLEERLQAPVRIDNDAGVAALGESRLGAGVGADSMFYVTLGSGVGGGMIQRGQIYHGEPPGESEIGHLRLDRQGTILESVCSGWAMDRRVREWWSEVETHDSPDRDDVLLAILKKHSSERGGEAKWLSEALEKGSQAAARMLDEHAASLALGLSHVTHLFHPKRIVLGGGFSLIGEPVRQRVESALEALVMEVFRPRPEIHLAQLGEDVATTGALLLASSK